MIDYFSSDVIFNMGSSGASAPELEVGDLVIATEAIQHDFDLTGWGLQPGELIFDVTTADNGGLRFHAQLAQLAFDIAQNITRVELNGYSPKVYKGRIISGDQFINQREKAEKLWDTYHSLCMDMEAAAIAHTCSINNVPFLCVRAQYQTRRIIPLTFRLQVSWLRQPPIMGRFLILSSSRLSVFYNPARS
jgi:adenosylhomocysteine nucleosidase